MLIYITVIIVIAIIIIITIIIIIIIIIIIQKIQILKTLFAYTFSSLSLKKAGDQPKRWKF